MQILDYATTTSATQTKQIASRFAKEISRISANRARVIALSGNLGAGKTTFIQGFARALGIKAPIQSPTFVLMKIYALTKKHIKHLVHIDAYRIEKAQELEHLGLHDILNDKDAIVLIEWADRVEKILPNDAIWVRFEHGKNVHERIIKIRKHKLFFERKL